MDKLSIYFHKDFDGMVSAAILSSIFTKKYKDITFEYYPVDHDLKDNWLTISLEKPAAVLDFFYHQDATYYYDHHSISFLESSQAEAYEETQNTFVDTSFKSTPAILRYKFKDVFDFEPFDELLKWSDIIDNADYQSPQEIYDNRSPYLHLNKLISHYYQDKTRLIEIIPYIMKHQIHSYLEKNHDLLAKIIEKERTIVENFKTKTTLLDNICVYDQSDVSIPFQRYLPYYYYPEVDYVCSIYRKYTHFAIVLSRNPWKENSLINLGDVVKKYGGYGRLNVAGVLCDTHQEATDLLETIIEQLKSVLN
ncbi:hypothetical protein [Halalkalibacter urbisdiaboli]|uniref:hypothetical protein n=1 Tax=Halalkalibacter urbisdiaboli TaxID=1960589 RepID=UPI000B44EAEE|nr:hypothetical protein [Halalkalibacter urbisdiaboli]